MSTIIPKKILGDCRAGMLSLPAKHFHLCVTSPPYWALRRYLPDGHPLKHLEIGNEPTVEQYLEHIVEVFSGVHRVLRDDGLLWINMGDKYSSGGRRSYDKNARSKTGIVDNHPSAGVMRPNDPQGIKKKDLMLMPSRVAMALQAAGWYLRAQVPWLKRNCLSGGTWLYVRSQKGDMPMMVKDMVRLRPETIKLWNGIRWTQVVDIHNANDSRDEIEIELRSGERIGCTPEHRWPTERGLLTSSELKLGDVLLRCQLPDPAAFSNPELLPTMPIGWLVGLYLAEGWIKGNEIVLSGHTKETEQRLQKIKEIATAFDGKAWTTSHGGNAACVHIASPALVGVLKQYVYGDSARNKCLTNKCWQRSFMFLDSILNGYLEGDGHKDPKNEGRWKLGFCCNDNLARDLRSLSARLGMEIRLRRGKVRTEGKWFKVWRGELRTYRPTVSSNPTTFRRTSDCEIVALRKSRGRQFWDIGVEDDPHVFALASGLLTHNSMPESVDDRPAVAVEYFFMFSKSEKYFYDCEAVKIQASNNTHPRSSAAAMFPTRESRDADRRRVTPKAGDNASGSRQNADFEKHLKGVVGTRNRRNTDWWIESFQGLLLDDEGDPISLLVNPKGTTIKHFASYPPKLIEPIIQCSTSDGGCCSKCGSNLERIVVDDGPDLAHRKACGADGAGGYDGHATKDFDGAGVQNASDVKRRILDGMRKKRTVGFRPTCECKVAGVVPCRVLDCFHGTGTTSQVSVGLGRDYTGCEISETYFKDSDIKDSQTGLHLV